LGTTDCIREPEPPATMIAKDLRFEIRDLRFDCAINLITK